MTQTVQLRERRPGFLAAAALVVIAIAIVTIAVAMLEKTRSTPQTQAAAATATLGPFDGIGIEADAAIVIDMQSGKTLYEKNADVQLPIASLTKVALILAVAEVLSLDSIITIPYYAGGAGESGHLLKGSEWRVRDIIDFTLVASSNNGAEILADAANASLSEHYPEAPEDAATLFRMNDMALSLGLQSAFFLNVNGLDLSETLAGAYGSARDVATLYAYAAGSDPSLFAETARNGVLLTDANGTDTQNAVNTNDAQGAIPGLIMGKTGTTDLAGGNLAIVFDMGLAHPVVAVVLGSSDKGRFTDMQTLVASARKSITE